MAALTVAAHRLTEELLVLFELPVDFAPFAAFLALCPRLYSVALAFDLDLIP